MKKILFVCTGNTCRSPMAEIILKQLLKEANVVGVSVKSAGLSVNEGDTISPNSKQALKTLGFKVNKFTSKQLTVELIKKSHIVLCMTQSQKQAIKGFNNVFSLAEYTKTEDVLDPFGLDLNEYIKVASQLITACRRIINLLNEKEKN